MDKDKLHDVLEREDFKWVKQDLYPLYYLLNLEKKNGNGYFSLPLSKENIILNLSRLREKPKSIIERELKRFEELFNDFFTKELHNFTYGTKYSTYNHPPSKNPCPTSKMAVEEYIFPFEIENDLNNALENIDFNFEKIFTEMISKVKNVDDLIYLGLLNYITEKCIFQKFYTFEREVINDLKELLEFAEIDEEFINYVLNLDFKSGLKLDIKKFFKLFKPSEKFFVIFYFHDFNSGTCNRLNNISFLDSINRYFYEQIEKLPIVDELRESYSQIKTKMLSNEKLLPLFEYKDSQLKFLEKYRDVLRNETEYLYEFEVLNEEMKIVLDIFRKKKILKIGEDDEIILDPNLIDSFNRLYYDLLEKENKRIERNKRELLIKWLRSSVALDTPPKPTPEDRIKPPKKLRKLPSILPPFLKKEINILLGQDENQQDIYWIPENERNWNFVIVGTAGTGKTQTVKAILSEFKKSKIPYIIFDFRKDFILNGDQKSDFGRILDLTSISINPLELDVISPKDQKYQISDIIDLVYHLGDLQLSIIRKAIKASYEQKGISEEDNKTWKNKPPTFADLQISLEKIAKEADSRTKTSIEGIFARLDPIFDYNIFSAKTNLPFKEILEENIIIDLGILPNENLKAIVCEFFLRKLRYYLNSLPESIYPKFYIIIDEAHRLKYEKNSSIGQFFKEARKYGVGIILSTQDPVDFTELVYNNLGGIMSLQLNEPKYAKKISEHLGGNIKWQEVKNDLSSKFSAIVKFTSAPNNIKLKIIPYFKRK